MVDLPLLRTSERKDFKRCPQRWWWAWREGLRPQGPDPINLWFGTGIHLALAHWYIPGKVRGRDPRETFEEFVAGEVRRLKLTFKDEFGEWEKEFVEAGPLGESMLTGYLEWYGHDEHVEMIMPEQLFSVAIKHPVLGNKLVAYKGTFDGVFIDHMDDGRIKLWEHKTAKSISTKHLSIDDQAGAYWAIATVAMRNAGLIGPQQHIEAIEYNFLRKALPDIRPQDSQGRYLNKNGDISKQQPKPFFERYPVVRNGHERNQQIRRIQAESVAMERFRTGEQELYKTPSWNCGWDCQFFELCELHENSPDYEQYRDIVFRKRDPYADHRKSAAE